MTGLAGSGVQVSAKRRGYRVPSPVAVQAADDADRQPGLARTAGADAERGQVPTVAL